MESGAGTSQAERCYELAQAAGLEMSADMFAVVLDLLQLDVTPQGIIALLRAIKDAKIRAPVVVSSSAGERDR